MKKGLLVLAVIVVLLAGWQMSRSRNAEQTEPPTTQVAESQAVDSPAAAQEDGKPVYGGVLKWHEVANPPKLDVHMATDTTSARVIFCIFENLVTSSLDGQSVIPQLAESWSASEDALTWTFNLRKGVRFHKETEGGKPTENGGREVTAADWKWTFERMVRDKSPRAYFIDCIAGYEDMAEGRADEWSGIKVVDDYTIEFTLKEPFSPFLSVLAYNSFGVVPKEDIEKWGADFNFHPVGTGPFTFEEWVQDQRVTLKKNPEYWGRDEDGSQLPYLDGWELVVIPDGTVAWEEFKKGNIDIMRDVPDNLVTDARGLLGDKMLEAPQPGTYYFGFNMQREPFKSNKALRHAINYAVDRERINDLVLEGLWSPAKGVLPPSMPGYNPDLAGYSFDPERAKQLLAEAGFPDGFETTLQVNQNVRHKAVAEAVQAQVAELGIKLNVQIVDWGVHLDTLDRGETDMYRMGWVVDYLDPDNFLYVNLHSSNFGAKGNYSFYGNPEADKLMEEGRTETDPAKRIEIYRKAEQIIVDDAPWMFLFYYYNNMATQKWVSGATLPAFGNYTARMDNVWLTER
ncbi:MAG: ABC transporter substrate-binding protein [Synergistaceae bacterium]|jgi:peptide/nickel transport system substrate-binding protein/oligopeptide transport system substrate-binding protein|nr:ABC transporter substrate-binding protein [Synergistaceae bacterium]